MCGIVGYSGRFDEGLLERMSWAVAHRGPDDAGSIAVPERGVGLAHRRLSIIDLSRRGHQPMWDSTRSAAISYNGELYNYRELRDELRGEGFVFHSDSDTEVLLNLYLRDGPEMLSKLNGIFAFALWDGRRGEMFLARDGAGVKPLYYAETEAGLLFASELKALLQHPGLDRGIDPEAVRFHMLYLWCPSPYTMLRSVRKLEPGQALLVKDGRIRRHWRYYDLPLDAETVEIPEEEAAEGVRQHLQRAVERQLVADVPIGAFLSGGLDSSSVVAMAQRAAGTRSIQCFTIGFTADAARVEGMAEDLGYARRVAAHLGVDLHTIWVGPEMVDEFERMIFYLDEPQADPASINALFISHLELDLASHDGRFSYACLRLGARSVTGIEGRPHLVEYARENFEKLGFEESRFRFESGDIFEWLPRFEPGSFDVIVCFGFLYHTIRQVEFFQQMGRLAPKHLIIDSNVESYRVWGLVKLIKFVHRLRLQHLAPSRMGALWRSLESERDILSFQTEDSSVEGSTIDPSDLTAFPTPGLFEKLMAINGFDPRRIPWQSAGIGGLGVLDQYQRGVRVSWVADRQA